MDTEDFILHVKPEYIYNDITENVATRLETSNFELDRPLSR